MTRSKKRSKTRKPAVAAAARPKRSAPPARGRRAPGYLEELRALIDLVSETGVSDLEVQSDGRVFRIGRNGRPFAGGEAPAAAPARGPAAPTHAEPSAALAGAGAAAKSASYVPIRSPIVGTFYRAPAPDADPYVEEGQRISIGQTVCIVEAMKLMNEIQSEVSGRLVRICLQNSQPVEYGQELFLVDPEG